MRKIKITSFLFILAIILAGCINISKKDLTDILLINDHFKEKISLGEINPVYTKTGGLSLNYRNERQIKQGMDGTKFFQMRFGKTEEFLIKDKPGLPSFKDYSITKSKYINVYALKTAPDYKDNKIAGLFPAQSLHAHHFYNLKLKSEISRLTKLQTRR